MQEWKNKSTRAHGLIRKGDNPLKACLHTLVGGNLLRHFPEKGSFPLPVEEASYLARKCVPVRGLLPSSFRNAYQNPMLATK